MTAYKMLDRRELFLDGFLAEHLKNVSYRIHHPERREIVLQMNQPHENTNNSCFQTIVKTPERYLIYYRAGFRVPCLASPVLDCANACLCAAETTDGKSWRRCDVGISPVGDNVVLDNRMTQVVSTAADCPGTTTVFYDTNPASPLREKFKMIVTDESSGKTRGMYLFTSPDGLRFKCKSKKKFALDSMYDSQNLAFFDPEIGEYRVYHRTWGNGRIRMIRTHRTGDFKTFTHGSDVIFDDPYFNMELYTNQVQPYYRAPHILIGTPMRYCDYNLVWDQRIYARPGLQERVFRAGGDSEKPDVRSALAATDSIVMASRDGVHFKRYAEAFVRPGDQLQGNWSYADNFLFSGCIQTKSDLGPDFPDEMSFYRTENTWQSEGTAIRRLALRLDGFVSLNAGADAGEVITRPLVFKGGRLVLNVSTGIYGFAACEIQDADGCAIPGYSLQDAFRVPCDGHAVVMRWRNHGSDLRCLEGQAVRLRFLLCDADLYSMQFQPFQPDPPFPKPGARINPEEFRYV